MLFEANKETIMLASESKAVRHVKLGPSSGSQKSENFIAHSIRLYNFTLSNGRGLTRQLGLEVMIL